MATPMLSARGIGIVASVVLLLGAVVSLGEPLIGLTDYVSKVRRSSDIVERAMIEFNRKLHEEGHRGVQHFGTVKKQGLDLLLEVGYTYDTSVDATFADYPVGRYLASESPHATASLSLFRASLIETLRNFSEPPSVETTISGVADGIPVRSGASYVGDLGRIVRFPYYSKASGVERNITLVKGDRLTNEIIAFLRAYAMFEEIRDLPAIRGSMISLEAETTEAIGGLHRRVVVKVVLKSILKDAYDELSEPAKMLERAIL